MANADAEGIDALGEVSVRIQPEADTTTNDKINPQHDSKTTSRVYHGHGAHTDVIVASAKAYIAAINRILAIREASSDTQKNTGSAA